MKKKAMDIKTNKDLEIKLAIIKRRKRSMWRSIKTNSERSRHLKLRRVKLETESKGILELLTKRIKE